MQWLGAGDYARYLWHIEQLAARPVRHEEEVRLIAALATSPLDFAADIWALADHIRHPIHLLPYVDQLERIMPTTQDWPKLRERIMQRTKV